LFVELLVKANTGLEVQVEVLLPEAHREVLGVVHQEDLVLRAIPLIHPVDLAVDQEAAHKVDLVEEMVEAKEMEANQTPWKKLYLEYQEMTILYFLKYQRHPLFVMGLQMEDIMLILKLSAKHSTFVPMMEMVV